MSPSAPYRVLSFESRKGDEMRSLIERHQGIATIAPSMKEVTLGMTPDISRFLDGLKAKRFDLLILMTGVGVEALQTSCQSEVPLEGFCDLLRTTRIVVRGPKPAAVLKRWAVPFAAKAEEPNTWREVLTSVLEVMPPSSGRRLENNCVAVQEYGAPSRELYAELEALGASVEPVSVYQWALPDDLAPLKQAIRDTIAGAYDVLLFTTAQQLVHLLQVADAEGLRDEWLTAARNCVISSIGPTASERLREFGLPVDYEPSHPHMAHLVRETLEQVSSGSLTARGR